MHSIRIQIEVHLQTALHIGTGHGQTGVLDAQTVCRGDGRVYVPGATLKGRARYRFLEIAPVLGPGEPPLCGPDRHCRPDEDPQHRVCAACNLFGSRAWAGRLHFGDLHLAPPWSSLAAEEGLTPYWMTERRTQVMLSRRRGVALEQRLFTTEVASAGLVLSGTVQGFLDRLGRELTLPEDRKLPRDLPLLVAALLTITHLGGRKSRGLGRCRVVCSRIRVDDRLTDARALLEALHPEGDR